jgi:putative endonuclease
MLKKWIERIDHATRGTPRPMPQHTPTPTPNNSRGEGAHHTPSTRERGAAAEDAALAHLRAAGLVLLARNYRTPGRGGGEIDLVMRERDGTLVFVEVRQRGSALYGGAGASIDTAKRKRIVLAAQHWLAREAAVPPCRFDAILVQQQHIHWLRGAFEAE